MVNNRIEKEDFIVNDDSNNICKLNGRVHYL